MFHAASVEQPKLPTYPIPDYRVSSILQASIEARVLCRVLSAPDARTGVVSTAPKRSEGRAEGESGKGPASLRACEGTKCAPAG